MADFRTFTVAYDASADVLYIAVRKEPASRGVESAEGIVWRYDSLGELIGATIMDFHELWSDRPAALARELSRHFHMPTHQAMNVVEHALHG